MIAVRQSVIDTDGGGTGLLLTLPMAPVEGNVIFVVIGGQNFVGAPTLGSGPALTQISGDFRAHSSLGNIGRMYYRVVQSGDGDTWDYDPASAQTAVLAELTGLDPNGSPQNIVNDPDNNSTTLAIPQSAAAIGGFTTRLEAGTFSPNSDTTVAAQFINGGTGPSSALLAFIQGSGTIGGTQGGTTRDGYWWGGVGFTWALNPADLVRNWGQIIG